MLCSGTVLASCLLLVEIHIPRKMPHFVDYFVVCGLDSKSLDKDASSSSGKKVHSGRVLCEAMFVYSK